MSWFIHGLQENVLGIRQLPRGRHEIKILLIFGNGKVTIFQEVVRCFSWSNTWAQSTILILVNVGVDLGASFPIIRRQLKFLNGLNIRTCERKHVELYIEVLLGLSDLEEKHTICMRRQLVVLKTVIRALVDCHAF